MQTSNLVHILIYLVCQLQAALNAALRIEAAFKLKRKNPDGPDEMSLVEVDMEELKQVLRRAGFTRGTIYAAITLSSLVLLLLLTFLYVSYLSLSGHMLVTLICVKCPKALS